MASIYKPKNARGKKSPVWHAAYYVRDENGRAKLLRKTTGLTDDRKALAAAQELERAGRLASAGNLTAAKAQEAIEMMRTIATGRPVIKESAAEALAMWISIKKKAGKAPGTMAKYQGVVNRFIAFIGNRAQHSLSKITATDISKFQQQESEQGKSPAVVNLDISILKTAFENALNRQVISHNPVAAIEPLPPRQDTGGRAAFTPVEEQAILATAQGEWAGVVRFGMYTGLRLSDVARITWAAVDLNTGILTVRPAKTAHAAKSSTVRIPILPPLRAWIEAQQGKRAPETQLFPGLAGLRTGGSEGLSAQFSKVMKRAGVAAGVARKSAGGKGRTVSEKSFHSYRHGFNAMLRNAGVPSEIRQIMLGHSSEEMNAKYGQMAAETLKAALAGIFTRFES